MGPTGLRKSDKSGRDGQGQVEIRPGSEKRKKFGEKKRGRVLVTDSGAAKSDVIRLIKKDWAMTHSFVLICIKRDAAAGVCS